MVTASSTNQEILEFIYDFIMTQGKRCVDQYGACVYKHGPAHCAVGCILSEVDCVTLSERASALYIKHVSPTATRYSYYFTSAIGITLKRLGYSDSQMKLLADLQIAHDRLEYSNDFRRHFRNNVLRVAEEHFLCISKLKGLKHYENLVPIV